MRIGLCTPCYQETVHQDHMLSAIATDRAAIRNSIDLKHYTAPGCAVLPRVRNRLVARALADKVDWLVFADDDIAWNARDFFKLMEHGDDIVAAGPAKRNHRWDEQPAAVAKFPKDGRVIEKKTRAGRLWNMDGVATGLMAIRASVFDKLEPVTTPYVTEGTPVRTWFWFDLIQGDVSLEDEGEDYNLCRKFREVGGSCWVDPDIRVRHYTGNVCHDVCFADMETDAKTEAA